MSKAKSVISKILAIAIYLLVCFRFVGLDSFEQHCFRNWLSSEFPSYTGRCVKLEYSYNGNFDRSGCGWYITLHTGETCYVPSELAATWSEEQVAAFQTLVLKERVSIRTMPSGWSRYNNAIVTLNAGGRDLVDGSWFRDQLSERHKTYVWIRGLILIPTGVVFLVYYLVSAVAYIRSRKEKTKNRKKK